jgi:hypothetical protein
MGRRRATVDHVLGELRRRDFLHPDVRVVCQRLSRDRGRPLHLIPLPLRTSISGAWLGMPDADYIVYQSVGSSPLHQIHVIWHEIGHMLLPGHARTCDVASLVRRSAVIGVSALAIGLILFAVRPHDVDFLSGPAGRMATPGPVHPVAALSYIVIVSYFAYTIASFTTASWRWAAKADLPWLRRGLRIHTVGCVFGLVFCVHVVGYQLAEAFGVTPPWVQLEADGALVALSLLPAFVGVTAPAWGPRIEGLARAARHYRHRRRLYPLWRQLTSSTVTLDPPRSEWHDRLRLRPGQQHALVYRRVIELWDGLLALHPTMSGEAGLDGPDLAGDIDWWLGIAQAVRSRPLDDVLAAYQGQS